MRIIDDIRRKKGVVKKQVTVYFGDDDFVPLHTPNVLTLEIIGAIKNQ